MTSSRSRTSRSSVLVTLASLVTLAIVGWVLLAPSHAEAGRKRVVVLELDGPKAEKFHADLIKLLKKTHTVVPTDKWNSTAEDLGATRNNDKDTKKVAKKLKVDAVVFGKIDKRRDEYLIQLQIRSGRSGQVVGNRVDTKSEGPRLDGTASRDLKDELVEAISTMGSGGGDDEDEEEEEDVKPAKKQVKKVADDEEEEEAKPAKKGFGRKSKDEDDEEEEETKPAKKGFGRKSKDDEETRPKKKVAADEEEEEEEEEDEDRGSKKRKKVASSDEDEDEDDEDGSVEADADGEEMDSAQALSLGERAIDAVLGLSFNMRRMSFSFDSDLASQPPPYKGVPVAGIYLDGTVFPLAVGHKRRGMAKNFGATVMYDRVLKIESKAMGTPLPTTQQRYAVGVAFRYPVNEKMVIGARVRYGRQSFTIQSVDGVTADIPNVEYTIIDPAVTLAYQAAPKFSIDAKLAFMAITNTGQIQKNDMSGYGAATVKGFEGEFGGSYLLSKNVFARAALRLETIGFEFKGSADSLSTLRDMDPEQDVKGARDSYYGGSLAVGVLY